MIDHFSKHYGNTLTDRITGDKNLSDWRGSHSSFLFDQSTILMSRAQIAVFAVDLIRYYIKCDLHVRTCTPFPRAPLHYLMRNTSSAPSSSIAFTCFLHELSVSSTTFISIVICAHHPKSSRIPAKNTAHSKRTHIFHFNNSLVCAWLFWCIFIVFSRADVVVEILEIAI